MQMCELEREVDEATRDLSKCDQEALEEATNKPAHSVFFDVPGVREKAGVWCERVINEDATVKLHLLAPRPPRGGHGGGYGALVHYRARRPKNSRVRATTWCMFILPDRWSASRIAAASDRIDPFLQPEPWRTFQHVQ